MTPDERISRLEKLLNEAYLHIAHWEELAKYQRSRMKKDVDWSPSEKEIRASMKLRARIFAVLKSPPDVYNFQI